MMGGQRYRGPDWPLLGECPGPRVLGRDEVPPRKVRESGHRDLLRTASLARPLLSALVRGRVSPGWSGSVGITGVRSGGLRGAANSPCCGRPHA